MYEGQGFLTRGQRGYCRGDVPPSKLGIGSNSVYQIVTFPALTLIGEIEPAPEDAVE
jgi:hypothetical protein